jgi:hypothetical protein
MDIDTALHALLRKGEGGVAGLQLITKAARLAKRQVRRDSGGGAPLGQGNLIVARAGKLVVQGVQPLQAAFQNAILPAACFERCTLVPIPRCVVWWTKHEAP